MPPAVVVVVVVAAAAAAVVIIIIVNGTPTSTLSLHVSQSITHSPVNVDVAAGAAAEELFDRGGGIGRSGCFFSPTPVLVARANNNDDKDGRIIVEET